jgi:hypothetical protein
LHDSVWYPNGSNCSDVRGRSFGYPAPFSRFFLTGSPPERRQSTCHHRLDRAGPNSFSVNEPFDFRCEAYNECRVGTLDWKGFNRITLNGSETVFREFHQNDLKYCLGCCGTSRVCSTIFTNASRSRCSICARTSASKIHAACCYLLRSATRISRASLVPRGRGSPSTSLRWSATTCCFDRGGGSLLTPPSFEFFSLRFVNPHRT